MASTSGTAKDQPVHGRATQRRESTSTSTAAAEGGAVASQPPRPPQPRPGTTRPPLWRPPRWPWGSSSSAATAAAPGGASTAAAAQGGGSAASRPPRPPRPPLPPRPPRPPLPPLREPGEGGGRGDGRGATGTGSSSAAAAVDRKGKKKVDEGDRDPEQVNGSYHLAFLCHHRVLGVDFDPVLERFLVWFSLEGAKEVWSPWREVTPEQHSCVSRAPRRRETIRRAAGSNTPRPQHRPSGALRPWGRWCLERYRPGDGAYAIDYSGHLGSFVVLIVLEHFLVGFSGVGQAATCCWYHCSEGGGREGEREGEGGGGGWWRRWGGGAAVARFQEKEPTPE